MQTIYLDISNKGVIPCVQTKQSEVGRKFLAVITDNGVPYNIPNDSLLSVWYEGDTDAGNYSSIEEKSAFSIDGNKVTVELVAQMLLKEGDGELCLSITHGDGGETNTWNIPYSVEYKPGAGSAVPTEYYTALTEAGAAAAKAATDAINAANRVVNFAEILAPVGYTFQWSPVSGSNIDLSTAQKVHDHFGFGTWEQIKDRFLLGAGDNYMAGSIGGSETVTLTTEEIPSHTHSITWRLDATNGNYYTDPPGTSQNSGNRGFATTGSTGDGQPHNNMPPYLTVYIWKRIA